VLLGDGEGSRRRGLVQRWRTSSTVQLMPQKTKGILFNEERHHKHLAWADFFREYDLLLCPTVTTGAFPHHQQGERWEPPPGL
jgi:Asp-tRNA(Asn)/Glu-tRNA(Gln) amidotransferase A subunit family amidase